VNRLIDSRWALAVVELFPVQVDLEASLTDGCQRDRDFTISASDDLCCQTYSLVPVASSDAVDDLESGFAFHCAVSPSIEILNGGHKQYRAVPRRFADARAGGGRSLRGSKGLRPFEIPARVGRG